MNPPPSSSPISQHLQHVIQGNFFCWRTCAKNQPAAWRGDDDVANVLYSEGGIQTNKVNVCNRGTCWQTYISWLDRSICGPGFCDVSCTVGTSRPLSVFFFGGGGDWAGRMSRGGIRWEKLLRFGCFKGNPLDLVTLTPFISPILWGFSLFLSSVSSLVPFATDYQPCSRLEVAILERVLSKKSGFFQVPSLNSE